MVHAENLLEYFNAPARKKSVRSGELIDISASLISHLLRGPGAAWTQVTSSIGCWQAAWQG
jgi:hypothetical protein